MGKKILKQDDVYSDYWYVYQSNGNLEFYLCKDGQFGYRQYGTTYPQEDKIVFKFHSEQGATEFLVTQIGYENTTAYIVDKHWDFLFDTNKSLLRECHVFKALEDYLRESDDFDLDYWYFSD